MDRQLLFGPRPQADQFTYRVRVAAAQTTHPKFTFAAGYPPAFIDWGDGSTRTAATSATEYTHTYTAAGEYTVTLILANQAKWLTQVDINTDKVISVVMPIRIFMNMVAFTGYANTAWVQNISNWTISNKIILFYLQNTLLIGDTSGWVLPGAMTIYQVFITSLSGCPDLSSMIAIQTIRADNCALPEATVDLYLSRCWAQEAFTTFATPTLNLGGTDAPPSVAGAAIALLLVGVGWIVTTS